MTVTDPDIINPALGRDSLLLAHTIELLGGGVPSEHPSCPGAVFRLAPDYDIGAPQPSADVVAKLLQGGSRPHGRWADNRKVTLPVVILGPDRYTIVAGRELLAQICDQQRYEVLWQRAGARGPMVLDAFRAGPAVPGYSVIEERQKFCRVAVTFDALPYGRSEFREQLWFPSPAVGGEPPPEYRPWEPVDDFTTVDSAVMPQAWNQADVPGLGPGNPWRYSAHWSPAAGRETPVYHRILGRGTVPAMAGAAAPAPAVAVNRTVTRAAGPQLIVPPPVDVEPWVAPLEGTAAPAAPARPARRDVGVRPAPPLVDISGRQHLTLWVGLGNSLGQWRSGKPDLQVHALRRRGERQNLRGHVLPVGLR